MPQSNCWSDLDAGVELTNRGKAFNGEDYENEYWFVFELEGGKIRRIREYADMHKVVQTLS